MCDDDPPAAPAPARPSGSGFEVAVGGQELHEVQVADAVAPFEQGESRVNK